jgi:hypothetical protein
MTAVAADTQLRVEHGPFLLIHRPGGVQTRQLTRSIPTTDGRRASATPAAATRPGRAARPGASEPHMTTGRDPDHGHLEIPSPRIGCRRASLRSRSRVPPSSRPDRAGRYRPVQKANSEPWRKTALHADMQAAGVRSNTAYATPSGADDDSPPWRAMLVSADPREQPGRTRSGQAHDLPRRHARPGTPR